MIRKPRVDGLVAKAEAGDVDAMNRLLEEAEGFIFEFARSHIANVADADDVAAEAMSAVWMKLPQSAPIIDFNGWLSTVIWNKINDYRRKQARIREVPESYIHHEEIRFSGTAKREMKEAESAYRGRL